MEETQLMISRAFDGQLTGDDVERLAGKLRDDDAWLDRYVLSGFIHSQLIDWFGQQRVQDFAFAGRSAPNGFAQGILSCEDVYGSIGSISQQHTASNQSRSKVQPARTRLRSFVALAAVMLVAASVALVGYFVATRPEYVGQLTQASDCRWAASQGNIPAGTLLESGQELQLITGRAVITFASGAQVLLEGPTSVRLETSGSAHLIDGRIAAKVPTHAIGFTVTTPLARFVDLGTEFTLACKADHEFELYVFEGLVESQLDERFGETAQRPLRTGAVQALRFDVLSGKTSRLPFNQGEQMPF
jgi:hypothetical protein